MIVLHPCVVFHDGFRDSIGTQSMSRCVCASLIRETASSLTSNSWCGSPSRQYCSKRTFVSSSGSDQAYAYRHDLRIRFNWRQAKWWTNKNSTCTMDHLSFLLERPLTKCKRSIGITRNCTCNSKWEKRTRKKSLIFMSRNRRDWIWKSSTREEQKQRQEQKEKPSMRNESGTEFSVTHA